MNSRWYRNLSIRGKLIFGFGLLMALFVGLLATAEYSLRTIYNSSDALGNRLYPKADNANDLIKYTLTAANSYRDLALSTDPAENREDMKIIRDSRENIELTLHRIEALLENPQERELFIEIKHKLAKLDAQFEVFFKLLETDRSRLLEFIPKTLAPVNDSLIISMQTMEDLQAKQVVATTAEGLNAFRNAEIATGIVGALSLLFAAFMSFFISRGITASLRTSTDTLASFVAGLEEKARIATAIANGDLDQEVSISKQIDFDQAALSRDEAGQLLANIQALNRVQISFDTALAEMTASLRATRSIERLRDWQKTGESQLNMLLRGEQDAAQVAELTLRFLAEYLKAGVGAFYLFDAANSELQLAASYAFTRRKQLGVGFKLGEGLIGQVAKERKLICWTQVPAEYLHIGSALGEAAPSNAIAVPIQREDALLGVIELGSFQAFDDDELAFLTQCANAIAIGLAVAESRQRVDNLLEETRRQAEKLREQQDQLQQSNEELLERARLLEQQKRQVDAKNIEIEAVSGEIQRKADELQRVSTYKSEFLANMSHELRTPLNSMMILSKMLMDNKEATLTVKQQEYAATINGAGKDLLNLINDILDLSKVEAGRMQFSLEEVSFAALTKSLETLFRPLAEQKGLDFEVNLAEDLPETCRSDAQRVQQILKNLLANAFKFTRAGTVSLNVALPQGEQNRLPVPAVAFSVRDSGIGIPAAQHEQVFAAFQQADGTTSRQYGGTGLGLSIARQLARHLGGDILLESTEGLGSVFTLLLPLSGDASVALAGDASAAAKRPAARTPAQAVMADDRAGLQPGSRSILIIEDDANFVAILRDMVRDKGFLALVAGDGESGCLLAEQYLPSAILLDVMLPGMDGWRVMRRLKDQLSTRHIPVHFITCLEGRQRAMAMGAAGFVSKPVTPQQLDDVLNRLEHLIERSVKRLLVVEDEPNELSRVTELLGGRDLAISVAHSGSEAIKLFDAEPYDCVVLDFALPDASGFSLLEHMQTLAPERRAPIIVHSGRALTRAEQTRLEHYAQSLVIKNGRSPERLLNEVSLFLHRVESQLPPEKQRMIRAALDKEAMLAGKKVLVVDDDMRNVFSLSSMLTAKGLHVLEAANGQEALIQLRAAPDDIDIVLMDVMMPAMDGYTALRAIRSDNRFRDIPLIAMTAKAMAGDREKCIEAGADDYISKPVDVDKLFSLLRVWLYERSLSR